MAVLRSKMLGFLVILAAVTASAAPPSAHPLKQKLTASVQPASYARRSEIYRDVHAAMERRGTPIGFFGAAAAVTSIFAIRENDGPDRPLVYRKWPFLARWAAESGAPMSERTRSFLNDLSVELYRMNAALAVELLDTGTLRAGNRVLREPRAIDTELVRREQEVAAKRLAETDAASRQQIIAEMDRAMFKSLMGYSVAEIADGVPDVARPTLLANWQVWKWRSLRQKPGPTYGSTADRRELGEVASLICRPADAVMFVGGGWSPSRVTVARGDGVEIEAYGWARLGAVGIVSTPDGGTATANGAAGRALLTTDAKIGALVARLRLPTTGNPIGDGIGGLFSSLGDDMLMTTKPVSVGSRSVYTAPGSGQLELAVNAWPGRGDAGSYLVGVRVKRPAKR